MRRSALTASEGHVERSQPRPALDELYRLHVREARRLAYLSVGDAAEAEDIVQDAFVRVLGRFGDIRKASAFKTYLLRTVLSLCKNHFRRSALERKSQPEPRPAVGVPVERDQDVLDALRRLPYRQRAAVVLRYCEDLSEKDTAEILQTSTKAVQSLVRRGIATLKKEVQR